MAFNGKPLSGVTVLIAVVEAGTIARAAEALGLSPSGVSRALLRLEQRVGARLETGYRFDAFGTGALGVTPYAAVQAQAFRTPAYSETDVSGGGFGLTYNAMTATDLRGELGARFDARTMVIGMPLILRARAAWAHDQVSNPALAAVFQALPGSNFIVNGAAPPKDSALASAGAELRLRDWSLSARFDGEFASGAQTYSGIGTLRYAW